MVDEKCHQFMIIVFLILCLMYQFVTIGLMLKKRNFNRPSKKKKHFLNIYIRIFI